MMGSARTTSIIRRARGERISAVTPPVPATEAMATAGRGAVPTPDRDPEAGLTGRDPSGPAGGTVTAPSVNGPARADWDTIDVAGGSDPAEVSPAPLAAAVAGRAGAWGSVGLTLVGPAETPAEPAAVAPARGR